MSKEESPPGGLLSKVVRFVRNPTVSWTHLDSIDADRESQYSKQMLKEMIERKRRNDFVRRREFDQLRKLRQRDALAGQRVEDPAARPSFFQSSLTSPDDRAVTIKKIDEIEAQMSMQWWKSKQNQGATHPAPTSAPAAAAGAGRIDGAHEHSMDFAPTAPLSMPMPLAIPAGGPAAPLFEGRASELGALNAHDGIKSGAAATSTGTTGTLGLPQLAKFVHRPDLEEAALRFANGDHDGAEASLQEVLAQNANEEPAQQLEIWMTLFDLYRATGRQESFHALALSFAARFDRSAPLWFSMPAQLGMEITLADASTTAPKREFSWNAPPTITLQTVVALQAAVARAEPPWALTWSRLKAIDEAALSALATEVGRWADKPGQINFVGADNLYGVLEANTQSGQRNQDPEWWRLRMAVLRLIGRPDEFEMVALDYCVTYEVSPPSWQSPQCAYHGDVGDDAPAQTAEGFAVPAGQGAPASTIGGLSMPAALAAVADGLVGELEGDATAALEDVVDKTSEHALLQVRCDRLIRIDFSAAGSVLNWAAEQQGQGRVVQFANLHRLVAVFFNVVGISEHSWVIARKD